MKKAISCIITAAMAIGSLAVMPAQAEDSTLVYGGLVYTKLNDSCVVLSEVTDKSITKVTIPDKIDGRYVDVDENAFTECSKLTEINVDDGNINVCDIDGVLFSKEKDILIAYPNGIKGAYNVPEGTEVIGAGAFENAKNLTFVNVPDSIVCIEYDAFKNCTSLTGFSKPVPADSSGGYIDGCTSLKEFELAEVSEQTYTVNFKFENCPNLEKIVIPENYVLGGTFKLYNCPELDELVLPRYSKQLLLTIGKCDKLTTFKMPESVDFDPTQYSKVTISECSKITEINLSKTKSMQISNMPSLVKIKLDSYEQIDNETDYASCPELKDVYYYNNQTVPTRSELEVMNENGVTIHCRKDSQNTSYLDYYNANYVFIEDEADFGDVNTDGNVTLADAVLIMQTVSNPDKYRLTAEQKINADVCGNDGITATDALAIQKYCIHLIDELPVL